MTVTVTQLRDEWADREAIRDCIFRYARGVDRADVEMLRSAYWPDAIDEHAGLFSGPASEFIDNAAEGLSKIGQTVHVVANILIRLDGDRAAVESYYYAIHGGQEIDGVVRDFVGAGRYLDRFERRGDEWRIIHRVVAIDWYRDFPDTMDWAVGPFGTGDVGRGGKKPEDRSYGWLGLA